MLLYVSAENLKRPSLWSYIHMQKAVCQVMKINWQNYYQTTTFKFLDFHLVFLFI